MPTPDVLFGADLRLLRDLDRQNSRSPASDLLTQGVAAAGEDLATWTGTKNLQQALFLRFLPGPLGAWVQTLALFPLFVPGIIIAYALIRFLGPTGLVPTLLKAAGITGYSTPYLHPSGAVIA